jgi:hypothetical protein
MKISTHILEESEPTMLLSGSVRPPVTRVFVVFAFLLGALFAGRPAYAQTTTNAENPCGCWIDAKTGKPVPTVPLSGANLVAAAENAGAAGVTQMEGFDPHADHASNSSTGQHFYRRRDGCWIDTKTGKPVPTVPLSGANLVAAAENAGAAGVTQMEAFDPHADHAHNPKTGQTFVRVPCPPPTAATPPPPTPGTTGTVPPSATPQENKTVSTSGFTPIIQLRGFGGATFVNGNSPAAAGFDGAVLFPLGNRVLVGPMAGFEWVDSSIVKTIGGGPPPSTFIHESVGFKSGNFGGRIAFPFGGWQFGVHGGATVASSKITQNEGFCDTSSTNPTAPPTCTVTSSSTTHDTVVGPFVGGYISHSIFPHVGVFVEYDYHRLKDTKSSVSVFDLHENDVVAGVILSFGRHKAK